MQSMRAGIFSVGVVALVVVGSLAQGGSTGRADAHQASEQAKNVILFIGDGMGPAHRLAGQFAAVGPDTPLVMDTLPVAGSSSTAPDDPETVVTDSAAGAVALASGVKTFNGAIGVDADKRPVPTILELAKAAGKATGLVTTSQVTDASPAAFGAHVESRREQSEIARQYLEESKPDVILGGGEDWWYPAGEAGAFPDTPPEDVEEASKSDKGNLVTRAQELGYAYVTSGEELAAAGGPKLLGLFANEEMFQQRPEGQGDIYAPTVSLETMTRKAIDILSQDPDGFFLVVEEEAIDEMAHSNNAPMVLRAVQELDTAVAVATQFAQAHPDTLVIVTADHETGGLAIEGLDDPEEPDESGPGGTSTAASGTPVAIAADEVTISGEDGPFPVANSDYAFVMDWTTTGHTALSVPVTALGPGAEQLAGVYPNTHIFAAVMTAMGLELPAGPAATPLPDATPVG
jgi:alkaline phosphatase